MNRENMIALLEALDAVPGVSGFEDAVGDRIAGELEGCCDESWRDALGNRLFVKKGTEPGLTVMLSAHMDEIGFMVSDISPAGYLLMLPVGFHDARLLQNQRVVVHTARGPVYGVTGAGAPPHELKGIDPPAARLEDLRVDIGARSRKGAENMGAAVGDVVTCDRQGRMLGRNVFTGRAVDNRAGCAAMIAALRLLWGVPTAATIVACASVQEELGVKGIRTAARAVAPRIALSFDVCFGATGEESLTPHARAVLGAGPAIQAYDWSPGSLLGNVVPFRLRQRLIDTAKRHRLPWQLEVTLNGGTDAAELALSGTGVLAGGINIPNRYMHSSVGTVDVNDVLHAAQLAAAFLRELDAPL